MKHLVLFISLLVLPPKISFSQQQQKAQYTNYIFDPKANAAEQLSGALIRAAETHKNLFMMVGGDWSYYSRRLILNQIWSWPCITGPETLLPF